MTRKEQGLDPWTILKDFSTFLWILLPAAAQAVVLAVLIVGAHALGFK